MVLPHPNSTAISPTSATVIDLFAGVGGLTHGLKNTGFSIEAGVDIDPKCKFSYERNNDAEYIERDIGSITPQDINSLFRTGLPRVLAGCAPCQPFSTYAQKRENPNWSLLAEFSRLIERSQPEIVSMENVPTLITFRKGRVYKDFRDRLTALGYEVAEKIVFAPDYGVPQRRKRLLLLASKLGPIKLLAPHKHFSNDVSVKSAIGDLRPIKAGEQDQLDPLHISSALSDTNLQRIRQSVPGGTWRDWDPTLRAACHLRSSGATYSSVYGRMTWDAPSPTITTQFYGYGNGRFGHPEQDRALSLREGALLQTFPNSYEFTDPAGKIEINTIGRMIGNAVPVRLGEIIGQSIAHHLEDINE